MNHYKSITLICFALIVTACGGGGGSGGGGGTQAVDTTPDAFSFVDQSNVTAGTIITSNDITVAGIDAAAAISVTDGEYAIDGGAFSSTIGTVSNGQSVSVRHTASSLFTTMTNTFLSIGGVSETFTSTTGPIGSGFNQARGFNENVHSLSPATDSSGDVYVGGEFISYNGTVSNRVIRLNGDGTVDAAFAVGSGFDSEVWSISPAIDGSGDVYVGGEFTSYNGTASNRLIRLNSDGTVHAAFAVGTGFDDDVRSLSPAIDGSGDVYVGGQFTSYNGTSSNRVIRLNSDGTVDAAFVLGSGFSSDVHSLNPATDGSGDVYVGGSFTSYNGNTSNSIIRLNDNGSVDAAFVVGDGFNNSVRSISSVTDGSGDVYVGGTFTEYNTTASNQVIRLNSDGSVEGAFFVGTGFDDAVLSLSPATDGSGDVYVGGDFTTYRGNTSNSIIRLNSDGTVDAVFVVGSGFYVGVSSIIPAIDGSDDVYVGGSFTRYNGTGSKRMIRLNRDGTVEAAFAVGTGFDDEVYSLSPATDGSGDVYVGGEFTRYNGTGSNGVIRLNSDGKVDATFVVGSGFNGTVYSLIPATDGSGDVYVGGSFSRYDGTDSDNIIRLNSDGTVDAAFVVGTGFDEDVFSISPATDGSGDVYVGGAFTSYDSISSNGVIRLNSNGTVDATFVVGTGFNSTVFSISPATDGSGDVYVGGQFSSYDGTGGIAVIRLNSNGKVDAAFAVGGGFNSIVYSLIPAADGSGDVYVGGLFSAFNGTGSNRVIRLNSDGSVDAAFVVGSGFAGDVLNAVHSISPATDGSGDVYMGGNFNSYRGNISNNMIRLKSDGTVATTFAVGSGFDDEVYSLSPATDDSGDVFVGGGFNSYQSKLVERIARLNPDGSLN